MAGNKSENLTAEILIIGAGVIGSSVAYHLAKSGASNIRVVDLDLEGTMSSSELNAGGVRATFNQPINIEMSKQTIEFFALHAQEMGYRDVGYLWLHLPKTFEAALNASEKQKTFGWASEAWDVSMIRKKIPFIDKTDDLAGAVFAPRDGLVNPNLVKNFYRMEARKLGVRFEDRILIQSSSEVSSTRLKISGVRFKQDLSPENKTEIYSIEPGAQFETLGPEKVDYLVSTVINCAGPWAAPVASILGYKSPAYPVRRQISIFDCRDVDLSSFGMIVDTSGVYFHPEAMNGLAGFATPGESQGVNFQYDGESFFTEQIWPALYERSSKFERLKHLTGWAGLYDVSPDESSIIGKAARGKRENFDRVYEAHSFSGHGVMHCHSAGIAIAELVTQGKFEIVDVSLLSAERFKTGKLIHESAVI